MSCLQVKPNPVQSGSSKAASKSRSALTDTTNLHGKQDQDTLTDEDMLLSFDDEILDSIENDLLAM